MRVKKSFRVGLLAFATLVVLLTIISLAVNRPDQKAFLLDGSELILRQISYGTKHKPPFVVRLKARMAAFLPRKAFPKSSSWYGGDRELTTSSNMVGIWFEHRGSKSRYGEAHFWAMAVDPASGLSPQINRGGCGPPESKLFFIPISVSGSQRTLTVGIFEQVDVQEYKQIAVFKVNNSKRR